MMPTPQPTIQITLLRATVIAAGAFVAIATGYWYFGGFVVERVEHSITGLRSDLTSRIEGREAEDRAIRQALEQSAAVLSGELKILRKETTTNFATLGDRIVGSNDNLRKELVTAIITEGKRTNTEIARLENRLDKSRAELMQVILGQGFTYGGRMGILMGPPKERGQKVPVMIPPPDSPPESVRSPKDAPPLGIEVK